MLPIHLTRPEDVPERLKLYQKARLDRVEKIQQNSRVAGKESEEEDSGGKSSCLYPSALFIADPSVA